LHFYVNGFLAFYDFFGVLMKFLSLQDKQNSQLEKGCIYKMQHQQNITAGYALPPSC